MKLSLLLSFLCAVFASSTREKRAVNKAAVDDVLVAVNKLKSWTDLYAEKYAKKKNLVKFAEKLRKQMIGKISQCREHPKPKDQKKRMDSISIGVMEKLISPELAENVRTAFGPRNPLEELAAVNKGLTKLIKKQLSECKRFQHFVRLRDTTMKQFSRAFLRLEKNQKSRLLDISGRMQQDESFDSSVFEEDAILPEDDLDKLEFDYADYGIGGDKAVQSVVPDSARSLTVQDESFEIMIPRREPPVNLISSRSRPATSGEIVAIAPTKPSAVRSTTQRHFTKRFVERQRRVLSAERNKKKKDQK